MPYLAMEFGGVTNGFYDVLIAGAAAQVAAQSPADGLLVWLWLLVKELEHGHEYPGSAEAALQTMLLRERLLNGVQRTIRWGQTFDGSHLVADCLHRQK